MLNDNSRSLGMMQYAKRSLPPKSKNNFIQIWLAHIFTTVAKSGVYMALLNLGTSEASKLSSQIKARIIARLSG